MELTILACEGGFYLARLSSATDTADIEQACAKKGMRYQANERFSSLGRIKAHFATIAPNKVWLVHNKAYDEMIGLPSSEAPHRQPLPWY